MSRAFTPKRVADLEPRVRQVARQLIDGFAAAGHCELVHDLGAPLPSMVMADLSGYPLSTSNLP